MLGITESDTIIRADLDAQSGIAIENLRQQDIFAVLGIPVHNFSKEGLFFMQTD